MERATDSSRQSTIPTHGGAARLPAAEEIDPSIHAQLMDVVQIAAAALEAPLAAVILIDGDEERVVVEVGGVTSVPLRVSPSLEVTAAGRFMELDPGGSLAFSGQSVRFFAGAPLVSANGRTFGALAIMGLAGRTLEPRERTVLEGLARHIVSILEPSPEVPVLTRTRAEEMYTTLIEHIPAAAFIADFGPVGKWHYVSPRIESMLGYTPEEWMSDPCMWAKCIHPDDLGWVLRGEEEIWEKREGSEPVKLVYRMLARDGRVVWVSDESVIEPDAHGNPLYYRGVLVDVSDIKEGELARHALEEQLRQSQKMDAIGRLAGGVAHDFNNLLSVILNYSRFVAEELEQPDPRLADVEEIISAGERASALVNQLLTFSRKEIVSPKILSINDVVANMENLLRRTIGEHIVFKTDLDPDLWDTNIDRGHMEQVIANLAVNARDAMPEGGELTISTRNSNGHDSSGANPYVSLVVSDTGAGIGDDALGHIFEPFFTTKPRGHGTGLGLSTVYGIVEQSGGHVGVETSLGEGTQFVVYLPAVTGAPERSPTQAEQRRGGNGEVILVAEDEEGVRKVVQRVLAGNGYQVVTAGSGDEALALANEMELPICVLLTDVVMPGMSGKELSDQLEPLRPGIKTLFMSGYTDDILARSRMMGDEDFIGKPFTAEELLAKVRTVIDG